MSSGKINHSPGEYQSQQTVLCPHCGYSGWRVIYTPDPDDPGNEHLRKAEGLASPDQDRETR